MKLWRENQPARLRGVAAPIGVFAVFAAQIVDAFIKLLEGLALFAIQQRFLPAGALQRAGAHAEQPHRAAPADILAQ